MIVCICNAVTERQLRKAIAEGAHSFDALQLELGIAMRCGQCERMAREILADEISHHNQSASCPLAPSAYAPLFFQPHKSA